MSSLKDIFSISRKRYTLHCKPTEIETHMRKKKKSFSKNHKARNFQRAGRFIRVISFTHPNTRACFQMISEHLNDLWTIGHILGTNLAAGLLASLSFTPLPCSFSWPSITLQPLSLRYMLFLRLNLCKLFPGDQDLQHAASAARAQEQTFWRNTKAIKAVEGAAIKITATFPR